MLLGRNSELQYLNRFYDRAGSQILVVYGQEMVGKTALLKEFVQDKPYYYYECRSCSPREQLYLWGLELADQGIKTLKYPDLPDVLEAALQNTTAKQVLILDEFQNFVKSDPDFMARLVSFVNNKWQNREILVVLISSSIGWVENDMISRIGEVAYELAGLLKIRELPFSCLKDYFTGFSFEDLVNIYAVFGGFPGLWSFLDDKKSFKENLIRLVLSPTGALRHKADDIVSSELRETGVYNTILACIAEGANKLNAIYEATGFSRAKISVYLKNMIELEIVEKVFSMETEGHDNMQKGIYRIHYPFIHFYFTFLYPHMSDLNRLTDREFYQRYIGQEIRFYTGFYFKKICMEYMQDQDRLDRLPIKSEESGEWVGKNGNIDIIMVNKEGECLIGLCNWDKPMMNYDDYEWLNFLASQAKISPEYIYLFSQERFDEQLELEAKVKKGLKLVTLKEMNR
ncbi:MAG: AAA family ATPase [Lachnospiraceae bacterium]|nr:AAA family ATPase [Lachnospiraceae bacterium]